MTSLPQGYRALVIGASGGIGGALLSALRADPRCGAAMGLSRSGDGLDAADDAAMEAAAAGIDGPLHLILCATGILAPPGGAPEKALRAVTPETMAAVFAADAIAPAMVFKHFAPKLPRRERGLVGVLTARVGSIGDNRLGGWLSYRAAKAAANQVVRTAAVELRRTRPQAVALALHPGTVRTAFTDGYQQGRETLAPEDSAARLLRLLDGAAETGRFLAHDGGAVPW